MQAKNRNIWAATLSGLVVGGAIEAALSAFNDSILLIAAGAFIGGLVAAYVLYGKIGQAAAAGALAGVLVTPFFLGLSQILFIFQVIPTPSGPTPSMSVLQEALVFVLAINMLGGAVGGSLGGAFRHPTQESGLTPAALPGTPLPTKYCVQCGAPLPAGAAVCPHCNATQPQ